MKFLIVTLCIVGSAFAGMNPECMAGPQTQKNPAECCPMPRMIDQAILSKCDQDFPTTMPPAPGAKMNGCCFSECIMNSTNILVNSAIDKATAIRVLTANADAAWVPIITAAIDKCQADAAAKEADFKGMQNMPPPPNGGKICHPVSGFLLGCVNGQVFKNCPADQFTANEDCNKIKDFVNKCGCLFPKKN